MKNSRHGCAFCGRWNALCEAPSLATSRLDILDTPHRLQLNTGRPWAFCSAQVRHRPCLPECGMPILGYYTQDPFQVQLILT